MSTATTWPDRLTELLRQRGVAVDGTDPIDVLYAASEPAHKLGPVLLSAWEAQGHDIGPAARAQLEALRRTASRRTGLVAELDETAGGITVVKGPSLAARYPDGWVRHYVDLDLCLADEGKLFAVWAWLAEHGFEPASVGTFRSSGRTNWAVSMVGPSPTPYAEPPEYVDLQTYDLYGHPPALPSRDVTGTGGLPAADVQAVHDVLAILEERFQRPFSTRDLLDVVVCYDALSQPARERLPALVEANGLAPEWVALLGMIGDPGALGLPVAAPLPGERLRGLASRRATALRDLRRARTRARQRLQRRLLGLDVPKQPHGHAEPPQARLRRLLRESADRMLDLGDRARSWEDGLLLFGVLVSPEAQPPQAWGLSPAGAPRIAETPNGRYLLTAGREVTEREVAEARRDASG